LIETNVYHSVIFRNASSSVIFSVYIASYSYGNRVKLTDISFEQFKRLLKTFLFGF